MNCPFICHVTNLLKALFLFCLISLSISSYGQTWNWATQSNGSTTSGYNLPYDIIIDANKNSYIVGEFDSPLHFGSVNLFPAQRSMFVARFDSSGICTWAKMATTLSVGFSITIDQNEDLIISGRYYGTAYFDTISIHSNGQSDIFVAKINSAGNWQWIKSYGGIYDDLGSQIATDLNNNIYVTGISADTLMFDTCQINGVGNFDAFIAKFNTSGHCMWVKNSLSAGIEKGTCITVSQSGTIYVGGVYSGDPVIFGDTLNSIGQVDEYDFISKLDTNGNFIWTKQLSCNATNNMSGLSSLCTDGADNVYFTGNFSSSCVLDTFIFGITPNAARNSYVAKLDSSSNVLWAKKGSGPLNNWGASIYVDSDKYCYVTGVFNDMLDFYDCSSTNNGVNGYVLKLDSSGNCMCLTNIKNTYPSGIYVDALNFWLTGSFTNTAFFGSYSLTTPKPLEVFIANSTTCPVTTEIGDLNNSDADFIIYPNPGCEFFNIKNSECKKINVEIYNPLGLLVDKKIVTSNERVNIGELIEGIYYIKMFCDKKSSTEVFIKQHF